MWAAGVSNAIRTTDSNSASETSSVRKGVIRKLGPLNELLLRFLRLETITMKNSHIAQTAETVLIPWYSDISLPLLPPLKKKC